MITDNKYKPSEWLPDRLWGGGGGCPFTEGPLVGGGGGLRPGWLLELPPWLPGVADVVLVGGGGGGAFILDWGAAKLGPLVGGGGGLAEGDAATWNYSQTSLIAYKIIDSVLKITTSERKLDVSVFSYVHVLWKYCYLWGTNFCWLKPLKFKFNETEHVHSLLVTVFKTTNSRIPGTVYFAETTKIGTNK